MIQKAEDSLLAYELQEVGYILNMNDTAIKEAIKVVHEYACIKALAGGEENQDLIDAFQILIDIAQLYLSTAAKMPKEKTGKDEDFGFLYRQHLPIAVEVHNQARQECILSYAKREQELKEQVIYLTKAEIQSGLNRVRWAELLIKQLPGNHEGRNSWLLNYGSKK